MIVLFFQNTVVSKPLLPTFIHDDLSRLVISIIGIVILSTIFSRIADYFNE